MYFPTTLCIFATITLSTAHSWVERLRRLGLNGTMVGNPGYIRGTISRLDPTFNDLEMQHLLPSNDRYSIQILDSDRICKETQTVGNYSPEFPPLEAHPGDFISLQHQENGHVSLLQNTPQKADSGIIYIYGTSAPRHDDKLLEIHKVWNKEGTGGNGRGRLLATWSFDDGQCYQINTGAISVARQQKFSKAAADPQGADLWCQTDVRLPLDIRDAYTIYWVWDWPSAPTEELPDGKSEIYTSCMDIKLLTGLQHGEVSFVGGQDLNNAAMEDQMLATEAYT